VRVKTQAIAAQVYKRDSLMGQAMEIGHLESAGLSWRDEDKLLAGLRAVTAEEVQAVAKEWEQLANIKLEFVASGTAQIRISFAEKGFSWSTVGTDALTVASGKATMNYGWLEPDTELREYQRVVRHEFGHALGMIRMLIERELIPDDVTIEVLSQAREHLIRRTVDELFYELYAPPKLVAGAMVPGIGLSDNLERASVPQRDDLLIRHRVGYYAPRG